MGRGYSLNSPKIRRRKAQVRLKARIARRRANARVARAESKAAAPAPAAPTVKAREKKAH